ncbi:MAG: valine--tRNA ligase [Chloroflexia bacterium]
MTDSITTEEKAADELESRAEMAKAYNHADVEGRWYDWWEAQGYFTPERDPDREPYTIIMPPPNVTGELHMGHALTNGIEDILIRYKRMSGYATLYLPGEDHAGISGQYVVEKELAAEGLSRHDLGREKFLGRAWDFMNRYRPRIRYQLRRLGASCDWTRERFTLDDGPAKAVRVVFKHLYGKGLIYKGERIINWCPRCATSLSDLEVEGVEEQGSLWTLRYPLVAAPDDGPWTIDDEGGGKEAGSTTLTQSSTVHRPSSAEGMGVLVATTRPETMLGDTAVAVHPDDKRWKHLVGKRVILPIMNREIPIVADEGVDPEFGTGAVKVTPGHDPLDFEIGQRHSLPIVNILNLDGTLNENAGPYAGQPVLEARQGVVDQLQREGYLVKTEPHTHVVPHCERCGTVLEPIVSDQWFVSMKPLAAPALEAVRDGRIRIVPERFTKVYYHWLENIRDWPISRQLWWGHRIPVWYCDNGHRFASADLPEEVAKCEVCGSTAIRQDPDVLDTWFSSGLWPFSTLGWPEKTPDYDYFYPTSVMETGYDILFFWVARMIFQGLEHTGQVPFHTVYLHGLVRDERGRKMSKSVGNVVDPLGMVDKYGSDALRMAIVTNSSPGNDQKFSEQRAEQSAHFANKLWNATRFVVSAFGEGSGVGGRGSETEANPKSLADRWILSRYNRTVRQITQMLDDYQLGEAGKVLQEFVWSVYCDWYIEAAKTGLRSEDPAIREGTLAVAREVLDGTLRLLHPYMPFLTEELWQHLNARGALQPSRDGSRPREEQSIMMARWPKVGAPDEEAERDFGLIIDLVREIRNARAEAVRDAPENVKKEMVGRRIEALIAGGSRNDMLQREAAMIASLARLDPQKLTVAEQLSPQQRPDKATTLVIGDVEVVLPLAGLVDLDAERKRLEAEATAAEADAERITKLLANEQFVSKAKPEVVQRERDKLTSAQERLVKLKERLVAF